MIRGQALLHDVALLEVSTRASSRHARHDCGLAKFFSRGIVVFLIGISFFFAAAVSASDALIILSSTLFNFYLARLI